MRSNLDPCRERLLKVAKPKVSRVFRHVIFGCTLSTSVDDWKRSFILSYLIVSMSAIINQLDAVITRLADLADDPSIDYYSLVILFGWLQTGFEVYLLQVLPYP